jgi:catalase
VRDPAKFPHFIHFIHTQKRDPSTHLTHADDSIMFWDYFSQNPASMHQDMVLMGDRGIPRWIPIYARLPWPQHQAGPQGGTVGLLPTAHEDQGTELITQEDSVNYSPDYSQKDLCEAIEKGDYAKWSVEVQTERPRRRRISGRSKRSMPSS